MRVPNLAQPPCETSLMGVVQGALAHYGIERSAGEAFVLSGHAFAINVREDLCPSGPYCWNHDRLWGLLADMGLRMVPLGTAHVATKASAKAVFEAQVRDALDAGTVCTALHLDHQLVLGYDTEGFDLAQPWGDMEPTPARITFGSWRECVGNPPVSFCALVKSRPYSRFQLLGRLRAALDFAVTAWREPEQFADPPYGFGPKAYANWLNALDAGHGGDHGAWWNGRVWGECRAHAGDYFTELAKKDTESAILRSQAATLAEQYHGIAQRLRLAAEREQPIAERRRAVAEARDLEADCVERIVALQCAAQP